ncbi:MAG: RNA polymerase sigma factor, partial [Mucinivorans sp.]
YLTHGDSAKADDLAQETFIKAWQSYASFRGGSFRAWLFTIAFRNFLDEKRRAHTFEKVETLDKCSYTDKEGEILDVALDCLDENEKNLLLLSAVEQFSHAEISQLTTLPLGSVKSTIKRAKTKLRNYLRNEED